LRIDENALPDNQRDRGDRFEDLVPVRRARDLEAGAAYRARNPP
jgi:hypothetical protein